MNLDLDEKIIKAVKARQALYNKKTKQYHDPVLVKKAWREVAAECGENGEEEMVKRRWDSIKLRYRRKRKQLLTAKNDPGVKERIEFDWPHFSMLDFMNKHIPYRKSALEGCLSESLDTPIVLKKGMNFAFDEHIIKAVEAREAIYNKKLKEHDDPKFIENAWREIAAECDLNADFVQSRWKSLKLKFVRKRRELFQETPDFATKDPPESDWPLFSMLSFLDRHLLFRSKRRVLHHRAEDETPEFVEDDSYDVVIGTMKTDSSPEDERSFACSNESEPDCEHSQSNHASTSALPSAFITLDNSVKAGSSVSKECISSRNSLESLLRENLKKSAELLENVEHLQSSSRVDKYMAAFTADIKAMPEAQQHEAIRKIASVIFDLQLQQ